MLIPLLKRTWGPAFHKNACQLGLSSNHWFLYQFASDTFLKVFWHSFLSFCLKTADIAAWELWMPGPSGDGMVLMLRLLLRDSWGWAVLLIRGRHRRMQWGSLSIKKTFSNITEVSFCMRIGLLYPKCVFFLDMFWEVFWSKIYTLLFHFCLTYSPVPYHPSLLPIVENLNLA